ncbi:hypothetical protein P9112_011090 [Eukaryota sp. TZLM1-RC]
MVLRWIPVLQFYSFDCVHVEGPKNHWADYRSRSFPVDEKKKKRKTRTADAKLVNSVISIDDGIISFHQVTRYDSEEHSGYFLSQKLHSCNFCPDVYNIRRLLLDELTIDNFIRIAKPLDTISFNYKVAFYDRERQAVVLPRSLPDETYSKKMFSLIPFQVPDLFPELACTIVNVTTRF